MTGCEHDGVPGGLIGGVSISQEQSIDIYSYISNGAASTYALPDYTLLCSDASAGPPVGISAFHTDAALF